MRSPLTTEPIGKNLLFNGALSKWFLLSLFCLLTAMAIKKASAVSIVILFFALISLLALIVNHENDIELKVLTKNLTWYRYYSRITLLSGAVAGFLIPFEFTTTFGWLLMVISLPNGLLIWPYATICVYSKYYTQLFGMLDA